MAFALLAPDPRFPEDIEVKEVAARWGMSVSAVHQLIKRNTERLHHHWIGNKVYLPISDVVRWENDPGARRRSRRRVTEAVTDRASIPTDLMPAGPGHLVYSTVSGESVAVPVSEKHIIVSPGEPDSDSPELSSEIPPDNRLLVANERLRQRKAGVA
jgi:hypothetical protein